MARRVTVRPRMSVVAVIVFAVACLTACGSSGGTLRSADVEKALVDGFQAQVGGSFTADCPAQVPAQQGFTFTCTVTDTQAGATVQVDVVEDDADGAFTWRATAVSGSGASSPSASAQTSPS